MKLRNLAIAIVLLSVAIVAAPGSQAVDPCDERPGYEHCEYNVSRCTVQYNYYYHDAFYVVTAGCYAKSSTLCGVRTTTGPYPSEPLSIGCFNP